MENNKTKCECDHKFIQITSTVQWCEKCGCVKSGIYDEDYVLLETKVYIPTHNKE